MKLLIYVILSLPLLIFWWRRSSMASQGPDLERMPFEELLQRAQFVWTTSSFSNLQTCKAAASAPPQSAGELLSLLEQLWVEACEMDAIHKLEADQGLRFEYLDEGLDVMAQALRTRLAGPPLG